MGNQSSQVDDDDTTNPENPAALPTQPDQAQPHQAQLGMTDTPQAPSAKVTMDALTNAVGWEAENSTAEPVRTITGKKSRKNGGKDKKKKESVSLSPEDMKADKKKSKAKRTSKGKDGTRHAAVGATSRAMALIGSDDGVHQNPYGLANHTQGLDESPLTASKVIRLVSQQSFETSQSPHGLPNHSEMLDDTHGLPSPSRTFGGSHSFHTHDRGSSPVEDSWNFNGLPHNSDARVITEIPESPEHSVASMESEGGPFSLPKEMATKKRKSIEVEVREERRSQKKHARKRDASVSSDVPDTENQLQIGRVGTAKAAAPEISASPEIQEMLATKLKKSRKSKKKKKKSAGQDQITDNRASKKRASARMSSLDLSATESVAPGAHDLLRYSAGTDEEQGEQEDPVETTPDEPVEDRLLAALEAEQRIPPEVAEDKALDEQDHFSPEAAGDEALAEEDHVSPEPVLEPAAEPPKKRKRARKSAPELAADNDAVDVNSPEPTRKRKKTRKSAPEPRHDLEAVSGDVGSVSPKLAKNGKKPKKSKKDVTADAPAEADATEVTENGEADNHAPTTQEGGKISGKWSASETERLDAAIQAYGDRWGLTKAELVNVIQYTMPNILSGNSARDSGRDVAKEEALKESSRAFWTEIREQFPNRTATSVHRIARRRWHNFPKRGGSWTEEEEELLRELNGLYPNQWKKISETLNRSPEDIRDRWRNYVQYGSGRKTQAWEDWEVDALIKAVTECIEALSKEYEEQHGTLKGYDPYIDLNWHLVSEKAGGTRSRLQCSYKWRSLQATGDVDEHGVSSTQNLSGTPVPSRKKARRSRGKEKEPIGAEKMLPGDKYELAEEILKLDDLKDLTVDTLPWEELDNKKSVWTPQDRKEALNTLIEEVGAKDDLCETMDAILAWLDEQYSSDELAQKYVPEKKKRASKPRQSTKTPAYKSSAIITDSDQEL